LSLLRYFSAEDLSQWKSNACGGATRLNERLEAQWIAAKK
jgi:hypothetical protein